MGRPRKTEEPVKERKTRTKKVEEPEVKTEQNEAPVLDEKKEDIPELVPEPIPTPDPEPEKPIGEYEVVNVTSWLNVRNGCGKNYPVVDKLDNGEKVNVYEIKDGWARISNDMDLWVSMEYLTKV